MDARRSLRLAVFLFAGLLGISSASAQYPDLGWPDSWWNDAPQPNRPVQQPAYEPERAAPEEAAPLPPGPEVAEPSAPFGSQVAPPAPAPAAAPCPPPPAPKQVIPECQWAGYKNGFFIQSCDGKYQLKFQGGAQVRYTANFRDADPNTDPLFDEVEHGFTVNRVPLVFSGNLLSPDLGFFILLDPVQGSAINYFEEAHLKYAFNKNWLLTAGRIRNPAFDREMDLSFARQLTIERSYTSALFSMGVCEGVLLTRQDDCTRTHFFVNDGRASGSTAASTDFHLDNTDVGITTGMDYKVFGTWDQFGDFTSWPDQDWGLFLGWGFHWEEGETDDAVLANDLNNFVAWSTDISLEGYGFNLFTAAVGRHSTNDVQDIDQYGFQVQTGYQIVPEKWEPFFRYEYICFGDFSNVGSGAVPVRDTNFSLFTFGVNRYFARHAAKITSEFIYAPDSVPVAASRMGLLDDPYGDIGQWCFRTQFQVMF